MRIFVGSKSPSHVTFNSWQRHRLGYFQTAGRPCYLWIMMDVPSPDLVGLVFLLECVDVDDFSICSHVPVVGALAMFLPVSGPRR